MKQLSQWEKVCQTAIVQANPEKHKKQFGSVRNFLQEYPVGGIFVGGEIIRSATGNREQIMECIQEYQENTTIPLLVAADGECGIGNAVKEFTSLPPAMAVGAARSEQLAYDFAKACALEASSIGINWTFAPVCDLNRNKHNDVTCTRSISDDPQLAIKMLRRIIAGFQENGLAATGKHFPGDGIDYRNQHYTTTCNSLSKEEWYAYTGAVFQAAIDANIYSMMIGHISLPAFQTDAVKGHYPPATLSKDLMTGLLKGELNYKGVLVTDALDMGGFVRWYDDRYVSEVKSFAAGADMLLWPRLATMDSIDKAITAGDISAKRLEDAFERISLLKQRVAAFGTHVGINQKNTDFAIKTSKELADKSGCLVVNELGLIPVCKEKIKHVRIVGITTNDSFSATKILAEEFRKRGATVDIVRNWNNYLKDFSYEVDRNYDLIVYAICSPDLPTILLGEDNLSAHSALSFDRDKTIIVSFGSPYFYHEYFETAETYVNSYFHKDSIQSFVAGVYGEKAFCGQSPVRLD